MKVLNNPQVYMEPGTYYIGDLCYVLNNSWDEFCELTIRDNECLNGGFRFADGREFVSFTTIYGDGTYTDAEGFKYPVDAGLIGCVRIEDMDCIIGEVGDSGQIRAFTKPFICEKVDGILYFGKVAIDLDPSNYNEDEDEEEYDDE
jgi:hypothetical protein